MYISIQKGESDNMNKIYKVIYSKVRHCYVVVSEIARNQGKAHSTHTNIPGGYVT